MGRRDSSSSIRLYVVGIGIGVLVIGAAGGCHRTASTAGETTAEAGRTVARSSDDVRTAVTPSAAPGPAPEGMVWIPGGTFWMGGDDGSMADAGPVHEVMLSGFWMDRTEVTNRQFTQFVKATGYRTIAERTPEAKDYPGAPSDKLVPGSIVFHAAGGTSFAR